MQPDISIRVSALGRRFAAPGRLRAVGERVTGRDSTIEYYIGMVLPENLTVQIGPQRTSNLKDTLLDREPLVLRDIGMPRLKIGLAERLLEDLAERGQ